jgi:hypothetical protein
MAFSRSSLVDQLEYEGFTSEQAEYGVSQGLLRPAQLHSPLRPAPALKCRRAPGGAGNERQRQTEISEPALDVPTRRPHFTHLDRVKRAVG